MLATVLSALAAVALASFLSLEMISLLTSTANLTYIANITVNNSETNLTNGQI